MLSLIIKIKDIHHCKETDHVYPIVRTGHGQPTWSIRATWFSRHHVHVGDPWYRLPRSTQPPVAPAASRLQYGRRRNANALREHGHIDLIEPILAIITVEK